MLGPWTVRSGVRLGQPVRRMSQIHEMVDRLDPPTGPPRAAGLDHGQPGMYNNIQATSNNLPVWRLHCKSTNNNTMATFTNENGDVKASLSGGKVDLSVGKQKFKHAGRASYEAGYQCAVGMFKKIETQLTGQTFNIALYLNGFGQGRDAIQKALMTLEGQKIRERIVSITDTTPLKVGGTRAKKQRRG